MRSFASLSFLTVPFFFLSPFAFANSSSLCGSHASKTFGDHVCVFKPSDSTAEIQSVVDAIYRQQRMGQFDEQHYALFFQPGTYNDLDIKVGYYTQVLGLGASPDDVLINGQVRAENDPNYPYRTGALVNFWRSAENLSINPRIYSMDKHAWVTAPDKWAVSQAAPLRRIDVKGDLWLFDIAQVPDGPDKGQWKGGYASGGFLANVKVQGTLTTGSQQQFFLRNSSWGSWGDSVWNDVFLGDVNAPADSTWGSSGNNTVIASTPQISEKPFLTYDISTKQYAVEVPSAEKNVVGISDNGSWPVGTSYPLSRFFIVSPQQTDLANTINNALATGQYQGVIFTAGVYHLSNSIEINQTNVIMLGLGVSSLVSDSGKPIIIVGSKSGSNTDGVKIAGLIFDAGAVLAENSPASLLQIGLAGKPADHVKDPIYLYDVYCRVGGDVAPSPGGAQSRVESCVTINDNYVIGDNLWLWRADHNISGKPTQWLDYPSQTGLIVNGNHVSMYGLAVEHFQRYQTEWKGDNGYLYFYQSEMPYRPSSQSVWMSHHKTVDGYASLRIYDSAVHFHGYGIGVYNYFPDASASKHLFAAHAIEAPDFSTISLKHMIDVFLNGATGDSGIQHVVDGAGGEVDALGGGRQFATLVDWCG